MILNYFKKCKICRKLNKRKDIITPKHLKKIFKKIKELIENDVFIEINPDTGNIILKETTIDHIKKEIQGSWGDIIDYYFNCKYCNQKYHLYIDTYHGSGGKWEPIKDQK